MTSLLITNGHLFTLGARNEEIVDGALFVEGDTILEVGGTTELAQRHPQAERLDAGGRLVLPGSICGHTHFYSAFARGMAIPGVPATNFLQILERLWWRLDKALTLEDVRYSALVSLADAVRHGTTTLIDHHASPNAIDGSLDVIADAVKQAGVRASLCYEVTDRNGRPEAVSGMQENVRFIKRCRRDQDPQLAASFGLHAAFTLSDETLATCATLAGPLGSGFHIHVAEGRVDQDSSLHKHGLRVVPRLHKFGILGPRTIAVHCIHLEEHELDLLAETGTLVSHQPRSNMNNAVGLPGVAGMLRRGIPVALGNDGFSNNMFDEMKMAYLAHKLASANPQAMPGDQVMQMAYAHNAFVAGRFFPPPGNGQGHHPAPAAGANRVSTAVTPSAKPLGQLCAGAFADIIFLDYRPTTPLSPGNLPWHLIFGVDGANITHTIAGGKVLMKDRQLLTLDEEEIMARSRQLAAAVWQRL